HRLLFVVPVVIHVIQDDTDALGAWGDDGVVGDTTMEVSPLLCRQRSDPLMDVLKSAGATQLSRRRSRENGGELMALALTDTGVGNGGKTGVETFHMSGREPRCRRTLDTPRVAPQGRQSLRHPPP
ncbi:MAG: hypothetical protein OXE94_07595, partial [Aestuariivita sp.]|nr:hypothetical protein [Aestuariivita sp.]